MIKIWVSKYYLVVFSERWGAIVKNDKGMMTMHCDRRLGIERRSYEYFGHYPERRMRKDRRDRDDRRAGDSGHEHGLERRDTD